VIIWQLYQHSSTFLDDYLQHFDQMLAKEIPDLHQHLAAQGFSIPMYGIEWFTTLVRRQLTPFPPVRLPKAKKQTLTQLPFWFFGSFVLLFFGSFGRIVFSFDEIGAFLCDFRHVFCRNS
jgi:hypothetical protein